jgi:hypothetical protein
VSDDRLQKLRSTWKTLLAFALLFLTYFGVRYVLLLNGIGGPEDLLGSPAKCSPKQLAVLCFSVSLDALAVAFFIWCCVRLKHEFVSFAVVFLLCVWLWLYVLAGLLDGVVPMF